MNDKKYFLPKKSVFNRAVGDNDFELEFAEFLENCEDIVSLQRIIFQKVQSLPTLITKKQMDSISRYFPDFL